MHTQASPIGVAIMPVTAFQQNCTLIWCKQTQHAVVIDPGGSVDAILAAVHKQGLDLQAIWLTHGHIDHAGGVAEMVDKTGLPVIGPHPEDAFLISNLAEQARVYGLTGDIRPFEPTRWLAEGDSLNIGDSVWEVFHTPGHTPGHVVFFNREQKLAQVGDVLFQGSIGRTDFPRGDHATLVNSIATKLWPLGDDVQFICGHGPASSIGHERRTNPYVSDQVLAAHQGLNAG